MRAPQPFRTSVRPSAQPLAYLSAQHAQPGSYGAQLGQALGRFGQVLNQQAEQLRQRREQEAQLGVNVGLAEFQLEQESILDGLDRNEEAGAAIDQQYSDQFVERANSFLDRLPAGETRDYAFNQITNIYQRNMLNAQQTERTRNVEAIDFQLKTQFEEAYNIVRADPTQLDDQVEMIADSLQAAEGIADRQLLEERARLYLQDLAGASVQTRAERDPLGVQLELQTGIVRSENEQRLLYRESGGDPGVVNQFGYAGLYQFGAPRAADVGFYTPGANESLDGWSSSPSSAEGKWSGTFNIPGFPQVQTIQDFLASPSAQHAAFAMHKNKMDEEIVSNNFDQYIGQTVQGVVITREGLHNMMHLGGVGSTRTFLEGRGDPRDANGTALSDYARMAGQGGSLAISAAGGLQSILRPEQMNSLMNTSEAAISDMVRARAAQDQAREQALVALQDQNYESLLVAVARGETSQTQLVEALDRGLIRAEQYRTLRNDYDDAQGGIGNEELALQSRVQVLSGNMGVEEIMALPGLSTAQRNDLVSTWDTTRRNGGVLARADVKAEWDRVDAIIGGVRGPLAILDTGASERLAQARQEFNDQVAANPDNAREIADNVIERYRTQPATLMTLPNLPFFGQNRSGTRDELNTRLNRALLEAQQERARDEMTEDEYYQFLQDASRYMEVINAMPTQGATPNG